MPAGQLLFCTLLILQILHELGISTLLVFFFRTDQKDFSQFIIVREPLCFAMDTSNLPLFFIHIAGSRERCEVREAQVRPFLQDMILSHV